MSIRLLGLISAFVVTLGLAQSESGQTQSLTMKTAMSQGEYAQSGIANLSVAQQGSLNRWLNRWTALALGVSCGGTYPNTGEKQSIEANADGKVLVLEDDSIWLVESTDQIDSALWLSAEDVVVIDAKHPVASYKYTILNTEENESVLAKYLGQE